MFSKETALKVSTLLSTSAENDIKLLMNDLIDSEISKMKYNMPEVEKIAALARIELCKKLLKYRKYLEDAIKNGSKY